LIKRGLGGSIRLSAPKIHQKSRGRAAPRVKMGHWKA